MNTPQQALAQLPVLLRGESPEGSQVVQTIVDIFLRIEQQHDEGDD